MDDHSVDIIYFDFAKAFDQTCLLTELKSYGLTGNLLGWLKSIILWVGNKQLSLMEKPQLGILGGVSQGSILGPQIYVNDMPTQVNSSVLQFANGFV